MISKHQINIENAQKAIETTKTLIEDAKMRQRYHFLRISEM